VKNIWFKFKLAIIVSGYALAAAVLVYFLIKPLVNDIKTLAYQIQAKSIDREIEKSQIEKLPEIKKEWSDYESRESLLNVVLGQQDQVSFIENIEAIAQTTGNKIDLKIEDGAKNTTFSVKNKDMLKALAYPDYFPIQISLEGDYAGLVNFVKLLENSQFYVNILSISATKNSVKDDGNRNTNIFGIGGTISDKPNAESVDDSIKTEIGAIVYTQKQ